MILVAILNTDRTRDLTPASSMADPAGKRVEDFKTSSGGEAFVSFMANELLPHINSSFDTAPFKLLIGHSFGGLTAMNIIINHTELFNSYIVIDPSMWWDSRKLLKQARDVFKKKFEGKSLFLRFAKTMQLGMDTLQVQRDTSGVSAHIRSILAPKSILQENTGNDLRWSYKYYDEDSHGSVPLITEYDGLRFLFGFYNFPKGFKAKLYDKNVKVDLAAVLEQHYASLSKHMGYTVLPAEDLVNQMGYYFLQAAMPERAYAAFGLNIKNYPHSSDVYDSMGNYYYNQKNKAKAREFYTKSLKVKETLIPERK